MALSALDFGWLEKPVLHAFGNDISILGLIGFAALLTLGLVAARFFQSDFVHRVFSRVKIEENFINLLPPILSLAVLVFFVVSAINAAGIPLSWNTPLAGIHLSLVQL